MVNEAGAGVIVLDNGGADIKVGYVGARAPAVYPNATAKHKGEKAIVVGDQILSCGDISSVVLKRPMDRGYVVDWVLQKAVWDHTFRPLQHHSQTRTAGLLLTEPLFNLPTSQARLDQVIFEDFQLPSFLPAPAALLSLHAASAQAATSPLDQALSGLVIDCGFSFTHIVPIFGGRILVDGIKRINLGGKALTNYMKELISYRSINMMEETYLVDHIKEVSCFVSQDLSQDLSDAKAGRHSLTYVLPDGISNDRGYIRTPLTKDERRATKDGKDSPSLNLSNERFMVPELLFHPSDVGMEQAGLAEAVIEATNALHPELRPLLFANILCTGGTAKCTGFARRLHTDLRPLVPAEYEVNVRLPEDPSLSAWHGGAVLATSVEYSRCAFTKADYDERGSHHLRGDPDSCSACNSCFL